MTVSSANAISRVVAMATIWPSMAYAITSALRNNWNGDFAAVLAVVVVALICGSAVAGTAFVWRGVGQPTSATKPVPTPEEEWARA